MHIPRRFGGSFAIAILIGLSVLMLVSLGEGFRIFVNHNDQTRLQKRDGTKYTFNMPWNPPTAVPTSRPKVKAASSMRESLPDAIKNVAAAILENVNNIASTVTSEATTLTSTMVVVPVALAATGSALSGGISDASSRGQQINVDTNILGDLIDAANSIVGNVLATGTDISNIGVLRSSSTASELPALIVYGNAPIQTPTIQASQESTVGMAASAITGPSLAPSVAVSTFGQSSLYQNTISVLPPSLTTSSLPINLPPQVIPTIPPKQKTVSKSSLVLTSSVLGSTMSSFPPAMPSPSSIIGFFNNSKSSSTVAQISTPSPVSIFSLSSFQLNSSTATTTLCPALTITTPTCLAPVTEIYTVTETWHSTHYEQTATLFSFMSIITVTCMETISVCPQSAAYLPFPITAPLNLPSSGKSTPSTAAAVLDLVIEIFSTSRSVPATMPNLALDLPTLPTGSLAPKIGAERAFPAAPNRSLITSIPMSATSTLNKFSSNAQSGVPPIISNSLSAAGQTTSAVISTSGAATNAASSLLSGAEGVMPSALSTIAVILGGLLGGPALVNAAFVSGSVTSIASTTSLKGFSGFQPMERGLEGKVAVGAGLKDRRGKNRVESKEAWHEATFCEGLPKHESCG